MPRLGSAIASTILSYAAVSLVGVDQVQAAVFTYNFQVEESGGGGGVFKFSDSSLTGIGLESLAVTEGRFNGFTAPRYDGSGFSTPTNIQQGKEYYDLVGATVVFLQGELVGLMNASGNDGSSIEFDLPDSPFYIKYASSVSWYIYSHGLILDGIKRSSSSFYGYGYTLISNREGVLAIDGRRSIYGAKVSYTLVNTEAEPVPEPLTAGGTALALAGLSWLKHKKKMAA